MIKKLRVKFIAVAMISVMVVLSIILGTINVLNYRAVVEDAENTLKILADNDGKFPEQRSPGEDSTTEAVRFRRKKGTTGRQSGKKSCDVTGASI